jgi:hypothetical protein
VDLVVFLLIVVVAAVGGIWLGLRLAPVFISFGSDESKEKDAGITAAEADVLAAEADTTAVSPPVVSVDNGPNVEHPGGTSD